MHDIDSGLQLYLKLNETRPGVAGGLEAHDSSPAERHAKLPDQIGEDAADRFGLPFAVTDDRFGSCLTFNGKDDYLLVEQLADEFEAPGSFTVAIWVKTEAANDDEHFRMIWTSWTANHDDPNYLLALSGNSWQIYTYDNDFTPGVVTEGRWHHLAITVDKTGKFVAFQDGEAVLQENVGERSFGAGGFVIGQLRAEDLDYAYAGKLAHLRIYDRALSGDEIKEAMGADITALAAFRTTHPIEFELVNEDEEPVLYIGDEQTQRLTLTVTNTSDRDIEIRPTGAHRASLENHQFQLQFRPGTLSEASKEMLRKEVSFVKLLAWAQGWDIHYDPDPDDLIDWLSLLWIGTQNGIGLLMMHIGELENEQDQKALAKLFDRPDTQPSKDSIYERIEIMTDRILKSKATLRLEIANLSAGVGGGTRATRVHLSYKYLGYHGSGDETEIPPGTRSQLLEIVNRLGKERIPLHVGFVGSHTILNNGTPNELTMRITNLTNERLSLLPPDPQSVPKFRISFDYEDVSRHSSGEQERLKQQEIELDSWEHHWVIGTNAIAQSITVSPTDDDLQRWNVTPVQDLGSPRPYWLISPKPENTGFHPAETAEFVIANISTYAPTGVTNLYVEYKNIPGYWDGEFVVPIDKAPLVYRPRALTSQGITFDGINTQVDVAELKAPEEGTIEAWVYMDYAKHAEGWQAIVEFGSFNPILMEVNGLIQLYHSPSGARAASAENLPLRKWCHVAATWSQGSGVQVFVDGKQAGFSQAGFQADGAPLSIGGTNEHNSAARFLGKIGRVRVWETERTESQIRSNMNRYLTGSEEGLIGCWPLAGANEAPDLTGAHDGIVHGAPDVDEKDHDETFMNVGIGTDRPGAKLHVDVSQENSKTSVDQQEPAAIFGGGSVGIGTQNPQADLDVAGIVRAADVDVAGTVKAARLEGDGRVPRGAILMWSGSEAPEGWALCDGENGTPDLRDRFIIGAGLFVEPGTRGEADKHEHTVEPLVVATDPAGHHSHNLNFKTGWNISYKGGHSENPALSVAPSGNHAHYVRIPQKETGENRVPSETGPGSGNWRDDLGQRPRWYALAFIIKL